VALGNVVTLVRVNLVVVFDPEAGWGESHDERITSRVRRSPALKGFLPAPERISFLIDIIGASALCVTTASWPINTPWMRVGAGKGPMTNLPHHKVPTVSRGCLGIPVPSESCCAAGGSGRGRGVVASWSLAGRRVGRKGVAGRGRFGRW